MPVLPQPDTGRRVRMGRPLGAWYRSLEPGRAGGKAKA